MIETEQCECCSNDFPIEEMVIGKIEAYDPSLGNIKNNVISVWLCKQCAMDLKV